MSAFCLHPDWSTPFRKTAVMIRFLRKWEVVRKEKWRRRPSALSDRVKFLKACLERWFSPVRSSQKARLRTLKIPCIYLIQSRSWNKRYQTSHHSSWSMQQAGVCGVSVTIPYKGNSEMPLDFPVTTVWVWKCTRSESLFGHGSWYARLVEPHSPLSRWSLHFLR